MDDTSKFNLTPAEEIRKRLGISAEEFSVRIAYNFASYPAALKRGYMTRRMAREISHRFGIPMAKFKGADGERG